MNFKIIVILKRFIMFKEQKQITINAKKKKKKKKINNIFYFFFKKKFFLLFNFN